MRIPQDRHKSLGSPFARPSRKPWLARPDGLPRSPLAMTAMVFFRHDFGERFLSPSSLTVGAFCLACCAIALRFLAGRGHFNISEPVALINWLTWLIFSLLFLFCTTAHLIAAARRRIMHSDEFSNSDGRPRDLLMKVAPFVRDEWDFELFFEPMVCFGIGALMIYFRDWFGLYLIVCAWKLCRSSWNKYQAQRALDLNIMDSHVEAKNQPDFDSQAERATTPIKPFGYNGGDK